MAKQIGLHKIRGKVGETSYYQSQVGGNLLRSINQGMSERVKSDPAFANTRLNASEFGGAGLLAGSIVRAVSQRWRYLLDPIATGKLSAFIRSQMALDTTHLWGRRELQLLQMPAVQDYYNGLVKNEMPQSLSAMLNGSTVDTENNRITIPDTVIPDTEVNEWRGKGIRGILVTAYVLRVPKATFDPASGKYLQSRRYYFQKVGEVDQEVASGMETRFGVVNVPTIASLPMYPQNVAGSLGGVLLTFFPYTFVNDEKYVLQEHCSCAWASLPDAE